MAPTAKPGAMRAVRSCFMWPLLLLALVSCCEWRPPHAMIEAWGWNYSARVHTHIRRTLTTGWIYWIGWSLPQPTRPTIYHSGRMRSGYRSQEVPKGGPRSDTCIHL